MEQEEAPPFRDLDREAAGSIDLQIYEFVEPVPTDGGFAYPVTFAPRRLTVPVF